MIYLSVLLLILVQSANQSKHVLVKSDFEFSNTYVLGLDDKESQQLGLDVGHREEHSAPVQVPLYPLKMLDKLSSIGYKVVGMTNLPNGQYDERILWTMARDG